MTRDTDDRSEGGGGGPVDPRDLSESAPQAGFFSGDGPLARAMPGYEERPQQVAMAGALGRTLAAGTDLMVEAGTGVGKTFAYLAPLLFDQAGDGNAGGGLAGGDNDLAEPAVVSTGTIALQEQLVRKDIPFLASLRERPLRFALLKGRSNYVCLRRLDLAAGLQGDLFETEEDRVALHAIALEVEKALEEGNHRPVTIQDLDRMPPPGVWAAVRAEEGNCSRGMCRSRNRCPFRAARMAAAAAELVVVNHALLIADMALRVEGTAILPDYGALIVDEAHRLENVAASNLGINVRSVELFGYLRTLAPGRRGGWLRSLGALEAAEEVRAAAGAARAFFDGVGHYLRRAGERTRRLRDPYFVEDMLTERLFSLAAAVRRDAREAPSEEARVELHAIVDRLDHLGRAVRAVLELSGPGHVFWAESDGEGRGPSLNASPVDVAATLREHLFEPARTVVLTSATLSVPGPEPFSYFKSRLGLHGAGELILGSPFRYSECVDLVAHASMPEPGAGEEYLRALGPAVMGHLLRNDGGAFVLFTSYEALNRVHDECAPELEDMGYAVLRQGGRLSVSGMLEAFRNLGGNGGNGDEGGNGGDGSSGAGGEIIAAGETGTAGEAGAGNAVLFGADSFWEGVDVPGPALSLVILTRLPFSSPGHPLTEARIEAVEARGSNPFRELTLPEAILRFKQGFGRLIRTDTDTGTVVVLDSRIVNKWYGRYFFQALPECMTSID